MWIVSHGVNMTMHFFFLYTRTINNSITSSTTWLFGPSTFANIAWNEWRIFRQISILTESTTKNIRNLLLLHLLITQSRFEEKKKRKPRVTLDILWRCEKSFFSFFWRDIFWKDTQTVLVADSVTSKIRSDPICRTRLVHLLFCEKSRRSKRRRFHYRRLATTIEL